MMTKKLSLIISYLCLSLLIVMPVLAVYFLFNLDNLVEFAKQNLPFQIIWRTVDHWQIVAMWILSVSYLSIGLFAIYYLRKTFLKFSKGKLFDITTTQDLRLFTFLIFLQGIVTPLFYGFMSVLLSWNHPPGQKILSIMLGTNEIKTISLALVFWVICNLLIEAEKLKNENNQFV